MVDNTILTAGANVTLTEEAGTLTIASSGQPGPTGPTGPQGASGEAGPKGDSGPSGPAGLSFTSGTGVPTGAPAPGTTYLDVVTGDVWQFA